MNKSKKIIQKIKVILKDITEVTILSKHRNNEKIDKVYTR